MTNFAVLVLLITSSALASSEPRSSKESQSSCESSLNDEADQIALEAMLRIEKLQNEISESFQEVMHDMRSSDLDTDFDKYLRLSEKFESAMSDSDWGQLNAIERSNREMIEVVELWKERKRAVEFEQVLERPELILPHRVYKVKSLRGDVFEVVFGTDLVKSFYWGIHDPVHMRAALKSIDAIYRGYLPSRANAAMGIGFLQAINKGHSVAKIHLKGRSVGSYRVYGVKQAGSRIYFVSWANETNHDAAYLSRQIERAYSRFDLENWSD